MLQNSVDAQICPVCMCLLLSRHVLEECRAVQAARAKTRIAKFLSDCRAAGVPRALRYKMFITGLAPDMSMLPLEAYLARGEALLELQASWLTASQ